MEYTSTLTVNGQITIPKSFREFLGVEPGDNLVMRMKKNAVIIERKMTVEEAFRAMDEVETSESVKRNIEKYSGMSVDEMKNLIREKEIREDENEL